MLLHFAGHDYLPMQVEGGLMRKPVLAVFALTSLPLVCFGQNALNGTWKIELKQIDWSKKPDVMSLTGGIYECKTCEPPFRIKADGVDQTITGSPYYDTVAIEVVNGQQIKETDKKKGQVVGRTTTTVSADGNTLTFEFSDSSASNGGPPVTGKGTETRVSKGPAGSHAISGSWRMLNMENYSDNGVTITFKFTGDELTTTTPTGLSYTAKLDGSEAPVKGNPGFTSVSVQMVGKDTLQETYKREGKPIQVIKSTVSANGKTVHVVSLDKLQNRTIEFNATKQ
jgi:hypothetical protein